MNAADARQLAEFVLASDDYTVFYACETAGILARELLAALDREESLTVGRATLEDQTNRAELAEARVEALEDALWEINHRFPGHLAGTIARAVLSGGSE